MAYNIVSELVIMHADWDLRTPAHAAAQIGESAFLRMRNGYAAIVAEKRPR